MHDAWLDIFVNAVQFITLIGAALMLIGTAITTVRWITASLSGDPGAAFHDYRHGLARTILIGLEILLAATIIKTITHAGTLPELIILLAMVAIRTFIGWTTALEMTGRWPWQKA